MKILIIGKVWPEPNSSAAGRRMKQLIELFRQRGEIHFACANALTGNEMDLNAIGVKIHSIDLNNDTVNAFFKELDPRIVVFDRFLTEEQYGWRIIEHCPNAIRILNTEDLHFLRKTRHQYVKKNNQFTTDISILDFQNDETMRELASIYRSDWTIMISTFEMELLQNEMQVPTDLLTYLPIFTEEKLRSESSFSERKNFLFIGNMLHEPNADAVKMLVENCWTIIRQECKEAELIIVGAYPSQLVLQLNNPKKKIKVVGHSKDLDEIYKTVRISLVPLRFGAGIKGKIMETLEYGIPFVSTSIGTEGLFFDEKWSDLIADNWGDFSQKAISLYSDMTKWNYYRDSGTKHLTNQFSKSGFESHFLTKLDTLVATIHTERKKRYYSQLLQHHTLMSTRYLSKWIMAKNNKS